MVPVEGMVELVFPAPNRPLSINEANSMHWAAKRRRLDPWKECTQLAWLAARKQQNLVKNKRCVVEIHMPFADSRRRDPHNFSSTVQKAIIDALVRKYEVGPDDQKYVVWEGCWEDDNPTWVKTLEPVLYKGTDCKVRIVPVD